MQLKMPNFKAFSIKENRKMASCHGLTAHKSIFTKETSIRIKNSLKMVVFLFDKGLLIEPYG